MKKILLSLILSMTFFINCQAFSLQDNRLTFSYPEDKHKQITIKKENIDIEKENLLENNLDEYLQKIVDNDLNQAFSGLALNKLTAGTGVINVTFQVKQGVKLALKESFQGYAEYQRRKTAEEVANSSFNNHQQVVSFISSFYNKEASLKDFWQDIFDVLFRQKLSFKNNQVFNLIDNFFDYSIIENLSNFLKALGVCFLLILIIIKILYRINHESTIQSIFFQPLILFIFCLLMIIYGDIILNFHLRIAEELQSLITSMVNQWMNDYSTNELLKFSWQFFANDNGYFPTIILSIFDFISQIFIATYFFGLIVFLCYGKLIYPFFVVFLIFENLRNSTINTYIYWLKILCAIVFTPLVMTIIFILQQELNKLNYPFLEIVVSVSSLYFLPFILQTLFLKSENYQGNYFGSFRALLSSIDSLKTNLQQLKP